MKPKKLKSMKRTKRINLSIYHVFMLLLCFILLYPALWMLSSSFKPQVDIMIKGKELIPSAVTLENYLAAFKGVGRNTFWDFARNSIIIAVGGTVGTVISCTLVAFGFARLKFPGRKQIFAVCIATMALPGMVLQIPQYLLFSKMGWVGTFLPLIVPTFFGSVSSIFMLMMFMRNVPKELDEAAKIDGCGYFGLFLRIMLPLIKPAVILLAVTTFIGQWSDFYGALIYLNKPAMYPLSLALKMYSSDLGVQYGPLMAMSVLSLIPILVLFVFFQKSLIEGVATVGLKG